MNFIQTSLNLLTFHIKFEAKTKARVHHIIDNFMTASINASKSSIASRSEGQNINQVDNMRRILVKQNKVHHNIVCGASHEADEDDS